MHIFVKSQLAEAPRNRGVLIASLVLAGILVGMLVAQLYSFEAFIISGLGGLFAVLIIVAEFFAVPFILRMRLSPAFRWLSLVSLLGTVVVWCGVTLRVFTSGITLESIPFFGDVLTLDVGVQSLLFVVGLSTLTVWTVWGLWPVRKR